MSLSPEFPGAPPPYRVDTKKNPHFDPKAVPFSYTDPHTGAVTTWQGKWDPHDSPLARFRNVIPDPATATGPRYPTPKDPDMTDLSDADKIRAIADWFDRRDDDDTSEVQDDLRAIARRLEDSVEPSIRLENALETMLRIINDNLPGMTFSPAEDEALEVVNGWLSER